MNGGKDSAEGHSSGGGKIAHILATDQPLTTMAVGDDKEVEEVTDMFADLAKKVRA
jgi:translation initiation factor 2 subunit 2